MSNFKKIYPIRNCQHEINDDLVTVLYVNKKLNFIDRTFFKKISSKPHKIDLDEIGSFIWKLCDGKNNVEDITEISRDHFKEKIEPAEERIEKFIKQLNNNKLVSLFEKRDKNKN